MQNTVKILLILVTLFSPVSAGAQFSRNLYFGLKGDRDVTQLQDFLRGLGHFNLPISTGNYFSETQKAVKIFQQSQNVSSTGYFGPLSRAAANKLLGGKAVASSLPSPFKGKIIMSVSPFGEDPQFESITLENNTENQRIAITGFVIENSQGVRFAIPRGHELPGFSAIPEDPIILNSGDRALITPGKQAGQTDFRMNICSGYFEEQNTYTPSINTSCPIPDTKSLTHLSDECITTIERTPFCRTPRDLPLTINSACSTYISNTLSYAGCVRENKSSSGFYSGEWRIWMQRSEEFFRNTHDKIILKDQAGRMVAEYSY